MSLFRAFTVGVALLVGAVALPAETGDPAADGESVSSSTQAVLPVPSETSASAADTGALTDAMIKRVTAGFRAAKRGDKKYYCRLETPLGTRLGKKSCYTLEQLVEQERVRILNQRKLEQAVKQRPLETN